MRVLKQELWPHMMPLNVTDTKMKIDEVEQWLGENVGGFKKEWNAVYKYDGTDYYFKDGKFAMLFTLRWS